MDSQTILSLLTIAASVLGGQGFIALLNRRNEKAKAKMTEAQASAEPVKIQMTLARELASSHREYSDELKEELTDVRKRARELQTENDELRKALGELQSKFYQLEARYQVMVGELERQNKKAAEAEKQAEKDKLKLNKVIDGLRGEVKKLSGRVEDVEQGTGQLSPIVTNSK